MKNNGLVDALTKLKGDMSVRAFAKKCSVHEATMLKYFNGSIPSVYSAQQIAKACNVSLDRLVSGDLLGEKSDENDVFELIGICDANHSNDNHGSDAREIVCKIKVDAAFEKIFGIDAKHTVGAFLNGYDNLVDADCCGVILIDRSVNAVGRDGIYVFRYHNEKFLKRLQRVGTRIKVLQPANSKYDPWYIDDKDGIEVLGIVKATIKLL